MRDWRANRGRWGSWLLANFFGWMLGFGVLLLIAVLWDLVGGGAQFMVGVGMGCGVGFMQGRYLSREFGVSRNRWWLASTVGLGCPLVLFDLLSLAGIGIPVRPYLFLMPGAAIAGVWQSRLWHPFYSGAGWWTAASILGWSLPVGLLALNDSGMANPTVRMLSLLSLLVVICGGGFVLGAATGVVVTRIPRRTGGQVGAEEGNR